MSDKFEYRGWADHDAGWAVPDGQDQRQGTSLLYETSASPPAGPSKRHGPSSAMLVLVGALVAFVTALGIGTLESRLSPATSPATSTAAGAPANIHSSTNAVVDKVDDGIVNITTTLGFQNGVAAGTGMVLTSAGQILTNNHVIAGSTRILATVATTGRSYAATVVGTSPTDDVAVLQLDGASNLRTVSISSTAAKIGDSVVAMGNAGGEGGLPSVATGTVIALDQAITATDEGGGNARRLTNLIQVSAPIESGDSGGPLANTSGEVIGIDTAASVGSGRLRSTTTSGYAIPIAKAMSVVKQIQKGVETEQIHLGLPGFLGVKLAPAGPVSGGAVVSGVESGTPAASAGLTAGDTIVSVDGAAVSSAAALSTSLQRHNPGDRVTIGWTTSSGAPKSAKVTLVPGPAD